MHSFDKVERSKVLQNSQTSLSMVSLEDKGKYIIEKTSVLICAPALGAVSQIHPVSIKFGDIYYNLWLGQGGKMGGYK